MAGNELQDYRFIFLGKRRISAKCSCQANNADATPAEHTHTGIEPPAFWLADDLCTPEPLRAAGAICIQFPGTGENKHSMFANRHMMTSALESGRMNRAANDRVSQWNVTNLSVVAYLYFTILDLFLCACGACKTYKAEVKFKLTQFKSTNWQEKVKEQKIIRSWTHGGNKMLLMIYDPEEKKEEAGINCQKSHEKTPKKKNGENCGEVHPVTK